MNLKTLTFAAGIAVLTSGSVQADSHTAERPDMFEGLKSGLIIMNEVEMAPAMRGVTGQLMWGDPTNGATGLLAVFSPGAPQRMHRHTSDYYAIVISGGVKHWEAGQSEDAVQLLGPGDSWFQGSGIFHEESYPTDEDTVVFMVYSNARDVEWFGE